MREQKTPPCAEFWVFRDRGRGARCLVKLIGFSGFNGRKKWRAHAWRFAIMVQPTQGLDAVVVQANKYQSTIRVRVSTPTTSTVRAEPVRMNWSATLSANRKPEQAALTSNAGQPGTPSFCWIRQAVDGNT